MSDSEEPEEILCDQFGREFLMYTRTGVPEGFGVGSLS